MGTHLLSAAGRQTLRDTIVAATDVSRSGV